ncbi:MAG: clan AA aspartic protease [Armatimonadota bacterium]|nr:clan AA aspartic protease [Armatimonadota bacterium]
MITGVMTAQREATLSLTVRGPSGHEQAVQVIIDTGFTGFLCLPHSLASAFALPFHSDTFGILGDGSRVRLSLYEATVVWDGQDKSILVLEAEGGALIGMALLHGFRVVLDVVDGGSVTIEALP